MSPERPGSQRITSALDALSGGRDLSTVEARQKFKQEEARNDLANRLGNLNASTAIMVEHNAKDGIVEKIRNGELSEAERLEQVRRIEGLVQNLSETLFLLGKIKEEKAA